MEKEELEQLQTLRSKTHCYSKALEHLDNAQQALEHLSDGAMLDIRLEILQVMQETARNKRLTDQDIDFLEKKQKEDEEKEEE